MSKGHWFKPLTKALEEAGFEMVRRKSNHTHWQKPGRAKRPVVVSTKLNDGIYAHKLASEAEVKLKP